MAGRLVELRAYLRQQPVMLALLAGLAVICFLAVTGLSRAYQAQRESLGSRWFSRGLTDLKAERFDSAVTEFRSALLYSPDDYAYQLNLAEALIGLKRTAEASTYLVNLWDREPEDGVVNLELARIAVQKEQTEQAQRYYHNAIYATWPGDQPDDQEGKRRDARLELIEFLLRTKARARAESELIALAENIGEDAAQQQQVGDLFVRTLDYERAFAFYRQSLKSDRHNRAALAGAGLAAFELARYPEAHRYLQSAVAADSDDAESAALLKTTDLVLQMDPFQRQISVAQRNRIVVEAFAAAGERIKACGVQKSSAAAKSGQPNLMESWVKMKPRVTAAGLQRNPDLVESAMDLVFEIERESSVSCGAPAGTDQALLLIAKLHEGN
ncbi:MAG: tetratricopeptide repeat protein [Candidatus Sulfotelmatobacter sp.]